MGNNYECWDSQGLSLNTLQNSTLSYHMSSSFLSSEKHTALSYST